MTVTNPPATTTPAAFKTWAQLVADDVNANTADIADVLDGFTATGEIDAPSLKATGKTGATTSPGILAGGTNTGAAPTTGAHVVGELVIGHDGKLWICTTAGTPGTWVQAVGETLDAADVVDLFTGTPDGTQFLRDDGTLATPAGGGGGSLTLQTAEVNTSQTTTSTSFTDLATPGPAVTITTGTSALVFIAANMQNTTDANLMSAAVSGASTVAAADTKAIRFGGGSVAGGDAEFSGHFVISGLTPGSNTFTAKYRVNTGTGTYFNRKITVIAL